MLILSEQDVVTCLQGKEQHLIDLVSEAYVHHAHGMSVIPESVFLRFNGHPQHTKDRIIALPAYLDGPVPCAGLKWISSWPGNISRGLARASAVIMLNDLSDGRVHTIMSGTSISARRTAGSAALAARVLGADMTAGLSLIGCGSINFELLRFLVAADRLGTPSQIVLYDPVPEQAAAFVTRCREAFPALRYRLASSATEALRSTLTVSIATTAVHAHVDATLCDPEAVLLHLSLRDLTASSIASCLNVVDDRQHALREGTSLALAEEQGLLSDHVYNIGDLLDRNDGTSLPAGRVRAFSPFGLGVLDVVVASYVRQRAHALDLGTEVPDFFTTH